MKISKETIFSINESAFSALILSLNGLFILFNAISIDKLKVNEIREIVGNYGYLAMILVFIMQFCTKIGVGGATLLLVGEVFPFK